MLSLRLEIPRWVARGIRPNDKGSRMDKYIYGADTETIEGLPLSMQFYSEDTACEEIFFVNAKTATDTFLKWVAKRKRNVQHVVYVHNLAFDLPEFFWSCKDKLVTAGGDFEFKIGKWNISGVYGTPTFCKITNGHDITVILIDSMSWFRGSLAAAAELFCPGLPKLTRPRGLGTKKFTSRDTGFCEYAMRDAVIDYHIGRAIEKIHQEFDLMQTVSVADMAARIFRHKFLTYTIPQPGRDVIEAALCSYHGGKNNVTVPAGWYQGVTSLDISSAYPHAMAELPAFANEKLYRRYTGAKVKAVPDLGVYSVSGKLAECDWPVIFSHGFKPLSGQIADVFVQGYELNEALRSGEFKPSKIKGTYYDRDKDHQAPALRAFVEYFYDLKERERDPVLRYMWKLILNSVSGKFIQTRKKGSCAFTDIDADVTVTAAELVAGGMFHPFIASAITAHTRARIHELEHKYEAIHTATDGIMTLKKAKPKGSGLGSLTVEASDGTLLLVRNKCYVLYTEKDAQLIKKGKQFPSSVFKGKYIRKHALHGFQGRVSDLEKLVATGKRKYTVTKPYRLKDALKRGLTPNLFAERQYTLKVGEIAVK